MSVIPAKQIGFDFDGVIGDIGHAFLHVACKTYGYCTLTLDQLSSFQIEESLNIPGEIIEAIFQEILEDSLATGLKPLPGAIETITRLSATGRVHVITARPILQPLEDWFAYYCSPSVLNKLTLIATGDHDNKAPFIRKLGLSHFIDDRLQTCQDLAASGLSPLVFCQPWNQGQHALPVVTNWTEIEALLDFNDL